ncbi:flagellar motor switch protein FliN [Bordetella genomosp. 10]|uniref:Flagellar motor switch protein FliN n=1 Tax=Bordetella genomosp. 10 TaxID=1416804 RepID=A0A261S954_9BORD|nr:flagellar motor switch protein FliN [Bordetella genomosp. 10]OZI33320.1 flagellar motor switch protein FliN [Bordetella genomosp. 10]
MTDPNAENKAGGTSPAASGADDWADALAEQSRAATQSQADGLKAAEDDPWAAAMAEQGAATAAAPSPAPQSAAKAVFKPLAGSTEKATTDIDLIMDVPVQLTVELGRTRLTIKNLLQLGQGSVVELDGLAGEPMDIFVNGYLIAQGEVVVVDEKYGIRLTDIITPSERINRLNGRR